MFEETPAGSKDRKGWGQNARWRQKVEAESELRGLDTGMDWVEDETPSGCRGRGRPQPASGDPGERGEEEKGVPRLGDW